MNEFECPWCGEKNSTPNLKDVVCHKCGGISFIEKEGNEIKVTGVTSPEERGAKSIWHLLTPAFAWLKVNLPAAYAKVKPAAATAVQSMTTKGNTVAATAATRRAEAKAKYDIVKNRHRGPLARAFGWLFWGDKL